MLGNVLKAMFNIHRRRVDPQPQPKAPRIRAVDLNKTTLIYEQDSKGRLLFKLNMASSTSPEARKVKSQELLEAMKQVEKKQYGHMGPGHGYTMQYSMEEDGLLISWADLEGFAVMQNPKQKDRAVPPKKLMEGVATRWAEQNNFDYIDRTEGSMTVEYDEVSHDPA